MDKYVEGYGSEMDGEREILSPRTGDSADGKAGNSRSICQLDGNVSLEGADLEPDGSDMDGEREIFCPRTGADWKAGKSMTIYQLDGNESMEADKSEDETGSECPPPWYDPYNREQEPRT